MAGFWISGAVLWELHLHYRMVKQKILRKLRELTGHDNVVLTDRGNTAITVALKLASKKVLIPCEGGWIHYKTGPKSLGLEILEVDCDNAKINLQDLKEKVPEADLLIYQNPGGYFAQQPMQKIYEICQGHKCLVVLDVSGAIGTKMCNGQFADIIVGSFGKWKLIEAQGGGFISSKKKINFQMKEFSKDEFLLKIWERLEALPGRIEYLREIRNKVIKDLSDFEVLWKEDLGFVVVVKGNKEKIIAYCKDKNLPYTECPRYIRVLDEAISIEVKRLQPKSKL